MATCNDIITRALRKLRVIGAGEDPTSDEAADGLTVLQSMYLGWVDNGVFGRLEPVITSVALTAEENQRIRKDAAVTVTIPTTIEDEDTGEDRAPRDLAIVDVVTASDGTRQVSVYDALKGSWVRLDGLALTDTAPLATRGEDGLACLLAVLLADEFGGNVGPITAKLGANFLAQLAAKPSREPSAGEATYY